MYTYKYIKYTLNKGYVNSNDKGNFQDFENYSNCN